MLVNQLPAAAPLVPVVQTIVTQLQVLSQSDPRVSEVLLQLQELDGSAPTAGSLVAKVALLSRLLAYLTRTDPNAAKQLAATLPALRALLTELRAANDAGLLTNVQLPSTSALLLGGPAGSAPVLLAGPEDSAPGAISYPSVAMTYEQSYEQAAAAATDKHPAAPGGSLPSTSVLTPVGSPISSPAPASGAGPAAGGGIGSGAPAIALLAMMALSLLYLVQMPGRLNLDLAPWRSTLLASRLERPG